MSYWTGKRRRNNRTLPIHPEDTVEIDIADDEEIVPSVPADQPDADDCLSEHSSSDGQEDSISETSVSQQVSENISITSNDTMENDVVHDHPFQHEINDFDYVFNADDMISVCKLKPRDDTCSMYQNSPLSVGSFAIEMQEIFDNYNIVIKGQDQIMQVLNKAFPRATLPIALSKSSEVTSACLDYVDIDSRTITISICRNGCVVFCGIYAELVRCPTCEACRFTNCTRKTCERNQYDECKHQLGHRLSIKNIFYRSIGILTDYFVIYFLIIFRN
jgi:hypothetical protein